MRKVITIFIPVIYEKRTTTKYGVKKTHYTPRELKGKETYEEAETSLDTALLSEPLTSFGEVKKTKIVVNATETSELPES